MTNHPKNTNQPGWLQRVFGSGEEQQKLAAAAAEIELRDQTILAIDQELTEARSRMEACARQAAQAQEQRATLEQTLAEMRAEAESLRTIQIGASARAATAEGQVKEKAEALARLERKLTDSQRSAEAMGAELEAVRKKLRQAEGEREELEARCTALTRETEARQAETQALTERLGAAATAVSSLEAELQKARARAARAAAAEQALEGLQEELEWAKAAAGEVEELRKTKESLERALAKSEAAARRASETVDELQGAAQRQGARLAELAEEVLTLQQASAARELLLEGTRRHLLQVVCLSARALDAALGSEAHLALEVGFAAAPGHPASMGSTPPEPVAWVQDHLAELGLAREYRLQGAGDRWVGHLSLPSGLAPGDALPLARWVAAYATECLNRTGKCDGRLESLDGGPAEFTWITAPRAATPLAWPNAPETGR